MHPALMPGTGGPIEYQDAWRRYARLLSLWLVLGLLELGPAEVIFASILPGVQPATLDVAQILVSFSVLILGRFETA